MRCNVRFFQTFIVHTHVSHFLSCFEHSMKPHKSSHSLLCEPAQVFTCYPRQSNHHDKCVSIANVYRLKHHSSDVGDASVSCTVVKNVKNKTGHNIVIHALTLSLALCFATFNEPSDEHITRIY